MQSFDGSQRGVRRCQQLQGVHSIRRRSRQCLLRRVNGGLSLIQRGLLESLDCPATHNISFIITIFIITIIYRCTTTIQPCIFYLPGCCTVILKVEVATPNHLLADQANSEPMLPLSFILCSSSHAQLQQLHNLHRSLHLSCIYHPRCHVMTCLLFIKICIHTLFSLHPSSC